MVRGLEQGPAYLQRSKVELPTNLFLEVTTKAIFLLTELFSHQQNQLRRLKHRYWGNSLTNIT